MPRKARIDAPGALHHIICRGIERKRVFRDNKDRNNFVERLGDVLTQTETTCYAWTLIPNHFHLLLKTGPTPISSVMRRLLTGHAVSFNQRHKRHGHLFQNRYKSILCQEDAYLLELVRYIHLNPLRAKLVRNFGRLKHYRYSGHSALMGEVVNKWQDTEYVLGYFGKRLSSCRKKYGLFVEDGISEGRRDDLTGGGLIRSIGGWKELTSMRSMNIRQSSDERILGDCNFVDAVLKQAEESIARRDRYRLNGFGVNELLQKVADLFGLKANDILTPGKQPQRVAARSLFCFWAVRELGEKATAIAEKLSLTQPAISRAVQRGKELAEKYNYRFPERNL